MSNLHRDHSIECVVRSLPSGMLSVNTKIVVTTPRAGRRELALFEGIRFPDFPYEVGEGYLAKRIRNMIAGATQDPELL